MLDSQYILLARLTNIYAKYGVNYTLWGYISLKTENASFYTDILCGGKNPGKPAWPG